LLYQKDRACSPELSQAVDILQVFLFSCPFFHLIIHFNPRQLHPTAASNKRNDQTDSKHLIQDHLIESTKGHTNPTNTTITMPARIVNKRRPASPLRVATAQVTAITTNIGVDGATIPDNTTTTQVQDYAPRDPRSRPIPIPKSPYGGINPRARINQIEDLYARKRLAALNTAKGTTTTTNNNNRSNHALTHANLATHNSLSGPNVNTTAVATTNNQTKGPTTRNPTTRALLSSLTPLTPIVRTAPATAPTTHTPPPSGPRPTDHYNGWTPVVYGGGKYATWVRTHPPAVVEQAACKSDPTPAQRSLSGLGSSHDRAVKGILAARKTADELDRSKVVREKREVLAKEEAEAEKEEKEEFERREPVFEGPEQEGCVCLKQAGYWSEVKCGRFCELV
jgi:hypothetical protein